MQPHEGVTGNRSIIEDSGLSPNLPIEDLVKAEISRIDTSTRAIDFHPSPEMKIGKTQRVDVTFVMSDTTQRQADIIGASVNDNQRVITSYMKVRLVGDGSFNIEGINDDEQPIRVGETNTWSWYVEPKKLGQHRLSINITAKIQSPDGNEEKRYYSQESQINVTKGFWSSIRDFIQSNWGQITGLLVSTGVVTGIVSMAKKKWSGRRITQFP
jgi:hypothetical protein